MSKDEYFHSSHYDKEQTMTYMEAEGLVFFRPHSDREIAESLQKEFGVAPDEVETEIREPVDLAEIALILAREGVIEDHELETIRDRIKRRGSPS